MDVSQERAENSVLSDHHSLCLVSGGVKEQVFVFVFVVGASVLCVLVSICFGC